MPQKIAFTGPGQIDYIVVEPRALNPGEIRVQTRVTGIRHGYDLAHLFPDSGLSAPDYPWTPQSWGAGTIIETGPDVTRYAVGDFIHAPMPHQDEAILPANRAYAIQWMRPEFTVFMEPSILSVQAIRDARFQLGQTAVVIGLGTLGQMLVQYLQLAGADHIAAIDPDPERTHLAQRLGAHYVSNKMCQDILLDEMLPAKAQAIFDVSGQENHLKHSLNWLQQNAAYTTCNPLKHHESLNLKHSYENTRGIRFSELEPLPYDPQIEAYALKTLASKKVIVWPIPCAFYPFSDAQQAYNDIKTLQNPHIKMVLQYSDQVCKLDERP